MSHDVLIKVDGVADAGEATALQAAGATVIGVDAVPDARYGHETAPSREAMLEIRAALHTALLCITLDPEAESAQAALSPVAGLSPGFLQVLPYGRTIVDWREAILAAGPRVVLDGTEISYEDEPAWVEARLAALRDWPGALIQADLLGDIESPWHFLTNEAPKAPGGLIQLGELADLAAGHDLVVSMEVTAAEVGPLLAGLPGAKGLYFRIGVPDAPRKDAMARAIELVGAAARLGRHT